MKIVIAPDSFKGSMSSMSIINLIKGVAQDVFNQVEIVEVPIADGGEGTIEALVHTNKGTIKNELTTNPVGKTINGIYGIVNNTAIIEMASCSGLTLLKPSERNPLETTSYGTGEVIKCALNAGFRKLIIGIGGSATNDGGTGAMQALGVRFYDKKDQEMKYMCGKVLNDIERIDTGNLDLRILESDISVMCDVTNPLTGVTGATYTYGPQKGGTKEQLDLLESGMIHYEEVLEKMFKKDIGKTPGAGAAGGIGVGLLAFLNAKLVSGIETVLELSDFDNKIKYADFIITGEGRVDGQSAFGKVVHGVTNYANRQNVPVIVIAGGVGDGIEDVYKLGVKAIVTLPNRPMELEYCMINTESLIKDATFNTLQLINLLNH